MNIKQIIEAMALTADMTKLPEHFRDDLNVDYEKIPLYLERGLSVIWLLRTCGSVMVPVGVGADPVYITHWFRSKHGQDIVPFHVTKDGVKKIDFDTAEKLISREPTQLSALLSAKDVVDTVDSVLETGVDLGLWGIFDKLKSDQFSNLYEWKTYFSNVNHPMMANFIGKAIRLIKIKPAGDLLNY